MRSLRLAIATADGVSVCEHLARSASFVILQIENGAIASGTVRQRGSDSCGSHASFVEMLEGCDAVVCGGIGKPAADSLAGAGVESWVIAERLSIDDAVNRVLTGTLETSDARVCLC